MYCKICGTANLEHANYCMNDGAVLPKIKKSGVLGYQKSKSLFCSNCGKETGDPTNYCMACGTSQTVYLAAAETVVSPAIPAGTLNRASAERFFSGFSIALLKKALIPSIIAFAFMLIVSIGAYLPIKDTLNSLFMDSLSSGPLSSLNELGSDKDLPEPGDIYGYTDTVMAAHFAAPEYHVQAESEFLNNKGSIELTFLPIFLFLIPAASFILAGYLFGRQDQGGNLAERFRGSLCIGAIYGVLISIFSLFSGFSYHVSGEGFSVSINAGYPFFQLLFTGLLGGTLLTFMGTLFSKDHRRFTGHLQGRIPFGNSLHQGFSAFIRIYAAFALLFTIFAAFKIQELKDTAGIYSFSLGPFSKLLENAAFFATSFGFQFGSYVLGMTNFIPLSFFGKGGNSEEFEFGYSLFTGFYANKSASMADAASINMFLDMNNGPLFLRLCIIIPVLFLIWGGYSLAKNGGSSFLSLSVFSLVFAMMMSILAKVSAYSIKATAGSMYDGQSAFSFSLGINSLILFFSSFIIAFACAFLGRYLAKWKIGQ
ncbi:zinc ribbon domain-containing protein [Metabacillus sp. KIGAM252]|uniref:Zinc ribbon domain-containing protein n=1 Tax=Metabacillus flavus TaxID=2823519 RepID=A0ABS5LJR9_9BACI|nr:zinc ribbon domain-containing protein [Metabacillus flavus]MBS2970728.1 zinc ribbon domain-containing protein [Metabacillus flavus]